MVKLTLALLSLVAAPLAASAATLPAPSAALERRQANPVYPVGIADAKWDGKCSYPLAAANFDVAKYVGTVGGAKQTWYQLAAQDQFFEVGCTCVKALYGLNADGTVAVTNTCRRFGFNSQIQGTATPQKAYPAGSLTVKFQFPSLGCPGPNYIVQKAWYNKPGEPENTTSGSRYETVIVSSGNFDGWFLLSRTQNVDRAIITNYLKTVAALGNDLSKPYTITQQTGCA